MFANSGLTGFLQLFYPKFPFQGGMLSINRRENVNSFTILSEEQSNSFLNKTPSSLGSFMFYNNIYFDMCWEYSLIGLKVRIVQLR